MVYDKEKDNNLHTIVYLKHTNHQSTFMLTQNVLVHEKIV